MQPSKNLVKLFLQNANHFGGSKSTARQMASSAPPTDIGFAGAGNMGYLMAKEVNSPTSLGGVTHEIPSLLMNAGSYKDKDFSVIYKYILATKPNQTSLMQSIVIRHKHSSSSSSSETNSPTSGAVPFILPDIGEGIKEVVIKDWLVKVGDPVHEFDGLCEVESDKATATISSRFEGSIERLHYKIGDIATVGKPLVHIKLNSSSATTSTGDTTEQRQAAVESSRISGVGEKASRVDECEKSNEFSPPTNSSGGGGQVSVLPSVRRLAREHEIDLNKVMPSGKNNRILKEDVIAHMSNQHTIGQRQDGAGLAVAESRSAQALDQIRTTTTTEIRVPIKGIRRAMFKQMTKSLQVPHFNYSDELDLTKLIDFVASQKQSSQSSASAEGDESNRSRVSVFAFIIKMVSLALKEYPQLNATLDESGEYLVQKSGHNIGIAIDTQFGLIVPNIKNVEQLSISAINKETKRLRELAYESKLGIGELSGASVSLSNIGAIGGLFGVPVIVAPEILIGALGQARALPRFNSSGSIECRRIMQVVWSADHRVVDGATLARFNNLLKQLLEQPELALTKLI